MNLVHDGLRHRDQRRIGRKVDASVVVGILGVGSHDTAHDLSKGQQGQAVREVDNDAKPPNIDTFRDHVHGYEPGRMTSLEVANRVRGFSVGRVEQARVRHDRTSPQRAGKERGRRVRMITIHAYD